MTREEQISIASCAYGSRGSSIDFTAGAKWADSNPKSPWISVEDDLPCNHEELRKDDCNTKDVWVILLWNDNPKHRIIGYRNMYNKVGSSRWYWPNPKYLKVTHWMPIPQLPKE